MHSMQSTPPILGCTYSHNVCALQTVAAMCRVPLEAVVSVMWPLASASVSHMSLNAAVTPAWMVHTTCWSFHHLDAQVRHIYK